MQVATFDKRILDGQYFLPGVLRHPAVLKSIKLALAEDLDARADIENLLPELALGDITSQATIPENTTLEGHIFAKSQGVIAGLCIAKVVFYLLDEAIEFHPLVEDGQAVSPGTLLVELKGNGPALLAGERTALNYLGRLSGIATLTRQFVEAIAGTRAKILDTRKTAPGLRHLDKYAVKMGGAQNHRAGLYDMVMIKDNHIDGAGGIEQAVARVRARYDRQYPIEVEVRNLVELNIALELDVERIMLDNMDLESMRQAVARCAGRIPLEASGNVSLATVRAIAETGVDYISSGALTHSAPIFDISMRLKINPA